MAEPLKNMYDRPFIEKMAVFCSKVLPLFEPDNFVASVHSIEWHAFELKQRVAHIARCLHTQLSGNYVSDILHIAELSTLIQQATGEKDSFKYVFLPTYIELYGEDYLDASLDAMETLTVLSTCEYAVRYFLNNHLESTMTRMREWSVHHHPSVRRFSTEGCRPSLPWGKAIPALKKDPRPILPILEQLKNDPSEYVRKSVANNLNDISKTHPEIVMDIVAKWKGNNPETDWILKHGARTLLKAGNEQALSAFGVSSVPSVVVTHLLPDGPQLKIGDYLSFSFKLAHQEHQSALLRLEYRIHYHKASGRRLPKVFKMSETWYEPNKTYLLSRKQTMKDMTTRKHYPGIHLLEIIVNGAVVAACEFELTTA
jgi:3-methyladenine DNA glycosylase AlkC